MEYFKTLIYSNLGYESIIHMVSVKYPGLLEIFFSKA
jgi:hypothetical protein